MKFEVRVYGEDGRSKGSTVLDSTIDVLDGKPVNSIEMARAYAKAYLEASYSYSFVDRISAPLPRIVLLLEL